MPFLDEVVSGLNQRWQTKIFACEPLCECSPEFLGIADTILDTAGEEDNKRPVRFPGIPTNHGEVKPIVLEDQKHFILYHRLESISNQLSRKLAVGDSLGDQLEVANMAVIVLAWRHQVKKPAYWIEAVLKDTMPAGAMRITDDAGMLMQVSFIKAGVSTFDKLGLINREYSELELNFPMLMMFEMKYTIESTYKKGCLDVCS